MKNINCYGKENKLNLVQEYYLEPILYLGLLPNQEKQGCCGKLTDRYYIFKATNKISKEEVSFYAGKHCAEELLKLTNKNSLPFFNPLSIIAHNITPRGNSSTTQTKKKLHIVNKQLINAIRLISIAWDSPPPVSTLNIISFTLRLDENTINKKGVSWVNEKLEFDNQGRTLTQMYNDLRAENQDFREFNFDDVRNYMSEQFPNQINRY